MICEARTNLRSKINECERSVIYHITQFFRYIFRIKDTHLEDLKLKEKSKAEELRIAELGTSKPELSRRLEELEKKVDQLLIEQCDPSLDEKTADLAKVRKVALKGDVALRGGELDTEIGAIEEDIVRPPGP